MVLAPQRRGGAVRNTEAVDGPLTISFLLLLMSALWQEVVGTVEVLKFGNFILHDVDITIVVMGLMLPYLLLIRRSYFNFAIICFIFTALILIINVGRGISAAPLADWQAWLRNNLSFIFLAVMLTTARINAATAARLQTYLVTVALGFATLTWLRHLISNEVFSIRPPGELATVNEERAVSVHAAIVMSAAVAMMWAQGMRTRWRNALWLRLLIVVLVVSEISTGQGTATIALLTGIAVLSLFEQGPRPARRFMVVAAAAVGLAIASIVPYEQFLSRDTATLLANRVRNTEYRQDIWIGFINYFKQEDLAGQLIGYSPENPPKFILKTDYQELLWARSIHSGYFGELAIVGYIGFTAYALMLLSTLLALLRSSFIGRLTNFYSPALGLALLIQGLELAFSYELRNEGLLLVVVPILVLRSQVRTRRAPAAAAANAAADAVGTDEQGAPAGEPVTA